MDDKQAAHRELADALGNVEADRIMSLRELDELDGTGEYTDNEWAELQARYDGTPVVDDLTFYEMSQDDELMRTLSEDEAECIHRWVEVEALRDHYALFEDFLYDCMTELMGFQCTELQIDIGRFLQSDIRFGMIQAQRSHDVITVKPYWRHFQRLDKPQKRTGKAQSRGSYRECLKRRAA